MTLCGFAYGLQGFWISAAGSVLGSSLAFLALRMLFSRRLNEWSSKNKKWQALESVVVIHSFCHFHEPMLIIWLDSKGITAHCINSHFTIPSMGIFEFSFCGTLSYCHNKSYSTLKNLAVHTSSATMAIHNRNFLRISQASAPHIHWFQNG